MENRITIEQYIEKKVKEEEKKIRALKQLWEDFIYEPIEDTFGRELEDVEYVSYEQWDMWFDEELDGFGGYFFNYNTGKFEEIEI